MFIILVVLFTFKPNHMKNQFTQVLVILSLILTSCSKKDSSTNNTLISTPVVTTAYATNITQTTAVCGGEVTYDGGATVTARGVCWNSTGYPTLSNSKVSSGSGTGSFSATMTGLTASTLYHVRAYATNSKGTQYGNDVTFTTDALPCAGSVTDIDGNVYCTVTIGTQTWMTQNLTVTHYRNGDPIVPYSTVADWSLTTSGRQFTFNINTYGTYYNWYAVNDSRNIAPTGWHVASKDEWNTLYLSLGGSAAVAQMLKMGGSAWYGGGSNSSGFSALPGGFLDNYLNITGQGTDGYWWTSSFYNAGVTINGIRFLLANDNTMQLSDRNRSFGMPVRCIKD